MTVRFTIQSGIDDETWQAYYQTLIQFHVHGTPVQQRLNIQAPETGKGDWVWGDQVQEVFVLSPGNPYSQLLPDMENIQREAELVKLVRASGINFENCVGMSPAGEWAERSLMLWNVDEKVVRDWGNRFEQNAYFRLTPETFEVISLVDSRYHKSGWQSQLIESDEFEEDYLGTW